MDEIEALCSEVQELLERAEGVLPAPTLCRAKTLLQPDRHPVYWVTWIGALSFARYAGARLPTFHEMETLASQYVPDLKVVNANYRVGDVLPAVEPNLPPGVVHHPVGNVQAWCADGPDAAELLAGPAARFMYGIAWNTPATPEELHSQKPRHLTGSSRGLGIQLVRDLDAHRTLETAATLAVKLRQALAVLARRNQTLPELEDAFVRALC
ncbi:MAG TPA: SUMF1/EgtB/PvdO family nonheme iron enzyme [Candidatus Saccharimonadales bacterium]|nr:SUMF1/EgtB/PvdO family nonheme iron enzyme [Candidatus Saccharimonadales bacterium]